MTEMQFPATNFNEFLKSQLNEHQLQAVTPARGNLLVIAGAGSGKTRVITTRITNLILNEGVKARSIVALTFTNKAAGEMKERLLNFLNQKDDLPFVGTFHSYCLMLLRTNAHLLPFAHFTMLDGDDQLALVKKIIKANNLEKQLNASQVLYQISQLKNESYLKTDQQFVQPLLKEIHQAYEAEKAAAHALDFDDLILQVLSMFERNKEFKQRFQSRVKHLLIDEYQDTSVVQHALLKQMALGEDDKVVIDSLCAVGDEDQSIYSWRGASVANMLKFHKDFAPVTLVKIEQNYRSVDVILNAANSVIANNLMRNPKTLWSKRSAKDRILHVTCRSGEQEAEAIAQLLKLLPVGTPLNQVAILYRTHFQSRSIEEALIHHGIPYKIVGGIRFYERKEIKDILAYLKLLVNPYDTISLLRIINTPTRGLGKKLETELMLAQARHPLLDFRQLIAHLPIDKAVDLSVSHFNALTKFVEIFDGISSSEKPSDVIDTLLQRTDYLNYLRTSLDAKEADEKVDNIKELLRAVKTFEQNLDVAAQDFSAFQLSETLPSQNPLELFLYDVALLQEKNSPEENALPQVNMMTLHAAKGLEFSVVIINGLDEGLLPSTRSLNSTQDLEEERRLFYVGITRAKEFLLLTSASCRNTYGQFVDQVESRFIKEIDTKFLQNADFQSMPAWQITDALAAWLGGRASARPAATPVKTFGTSHKTSMPTLKATSNRKPMPVSIKPASSQATSSTAFKADGPWQKNQRVAHAKFGPGIVTDVEKISNDEYYITAIFKIGKKKVLSGFLKAL